MSLRSGYWFVPKYILGKPSDTLNEGRALPAFLKTRIDGRMIRLITAIRRGSRFPKPNGIFNYPVTNTWCCTTPAMGT